MKKEEKAEIISDLKDRLSGSSFFYLTDSSELDVATVNNLRRLCFEKGVYFKVAKNTFIKRALDECEGDYQELYPLLKGSTSIMISEVSNAPAKLIKEFREDCDKPVLKGAFIDSDVYVGDDQVETLSKLKSKEELLGEVIGLLQSPPKNVISALKGQGGKIAGLIKTLSERSEGGEG